MALFGSSTSSGGEEHTIANSPEDTVSRLKFNPSNPQAQFICSGSWANDVRIWQIATQTQNSGGIRFTTLLITTLVTTLV